MVLTKDDVLELAEGMECYSRMSHYARLLLRLLLQGQIERGERGGGAASLADFGYEAGCSPEEAPVIAMRAARELEQERIVSRARIDPPGELVASVTCELLCGAGVAKKEG